MPLQPLVPRRLYRQIANQLRGLIRAGEYPVGSRLPPERDLALQLGVSRPSVREALIALEVEGLVAVRMGSGVLVTAREPAASATPVDAPFGPFEIIRARQVIECELAAMAALAMDAAALAGLQQALALMRADVARGCAPVQADRLFHLRIAEAADNGPLLRTVTELYDARNTPLFAQLGQHFETLPTWREALDEHKAVVDAIARHDATAARAAMHAHLQQSHDRLAGLWPPVASPSASPSADLSANPVTRAANNPATAA